MNQKIKTTKSGFSLIEAMVAIFVFSLASAMLAGAFSGFFKTYVSAKKSQKSAESAQYVMNLMAKTIRSSTLSASSIAAGQIFMFDNSRSSCVLYGYGAGVLKIAETGDAGVTIESIDDCAGALALVTPSPLTSDGEILGLTFSGTPSVAGISAGKITMSVTIQGTTNTQIQTTVSLRDAGIPSVALVTCNNNGVCDLGETFALCGVADCVAPPADVTKPIVTLFTVPPTSNNLTISGISFTASDAVGVTGYLVNESAIAPATTAFTLTTPPTSYTASSAGARTLYGWVRDAAGNVSTLVTGRVCTITLSDLTAPTAPTSLIATAASSSQIDLTWTASTDNVGVTGYDIYKGDGTLVTSTFGVGTTYSQYSLTASTSYSYYVKAHDAAGNKSAPSATKSATTLAGADAIKPTVTAFTVPATSSALTISGINFTATDNVGVTGYLINESATTPVATDIPSPTTAPTSYTASSAGAKTLYAWVKDGAGNVSNAFAGRPCTITPTTIWTCPDAPGTYDSPIKAECNDGPGGAGGCRDLPNGNSCVAL